MYARRFKCRKQSLDSVSGYLKQLRGSELVQSRLVGGTTFHGGPRLQDRVTRNVYSWALPSRGLPVLNNCLGLFWAQNHCRLYSSEGDGRSASDGEHVKDSVKTTCKEKIRPDVRLCDEHARLGVLDQQDWIANERLSIESKKKESPFLTTKERFKNDFLRRVVPWEKITVSWDSFPYFIDEHTKSLLVECTASHLKHKRFTSSYGSRLTSSSERILLQGVPGTELFRERLVRALARDLQVPLLVLDSSVLAHDFGQECLSEIETDDENVESGEESTTGSEGEDDNDASNEEEWASSSEVKSDEDERDEQVSVEAIKKLFPFSIEDFEKRVSGEPDSEPSLKDSGTDSSMEQSKQPLKKGDRVKYTGDDELIECDQRHLLKGQRGEVYEVNGNQVAVILDSKWNGKEKAQENITEGKPSIYWIDIQNIEHDFDTEAEDWYVAMEALCEILSSLQPIIVYFPDSSEWLSRVIPKSNRKEFIQKIEQMFDQLTGPIVLICGQNKIESGSKEKPNPMHPVLGHILPISLKQLAMGPRANKTSKENNICKLFDNVVCIQPPKEEELLRTFNKQIEEDRRIVTSRSNLIELQKVLDENELSCVDLLHVNTDGVILTKQNAEQVVGWARNHYLSKCILPSVKGERLNVPRESLEAAILRLNKKENISKKPSHSLKSLAKDEYESNFVSAVVSPDEIGVRFDDIGALEDVKRTLNELVILPMRRPELFSHGNLLRPCKGILLFGPPGTGKTLLAKALATEAGANFISITGSILTSKWFGDAEKLTKALFSFASRLAPVIIFVDEVDSLLGARGGAFEHEATRRMRNEFMAAWDGLRSKESQRILILGATNRPFDLDDAVIRRLPRRIYVDLPDAQNRMKILRIFLAQENIDSDFKYDELANATEGYSGSDLKNLCIAAAYRPVQELLEEEQKGGTSRTLPILRPLNLDDFIQAKAKVGASVAYDAGSMNELRKWNEQYGEGGSRKRAPFGFGD
ncbi:Katanin p60 ATPase-containing subunit A1 [Acorus gramineus]|uniref:Katanin p60 ATPase-containing subunit A1 n=1 Tax=Acorus gramineus TaxID=55184 RepID=A0AAV9BNF1_ACOGR|nr:Katanin p60 ATPase-containing subunit A1 [Acorus gramineus]